MSKPISQRSLIAPILMVLVLNSCASVRPIIYPNEKTQADLADTVEITIDDSADKNDLKREIDKVSKNSSQEEIEDAEIEIIETFEKEEVSSISEDVTEAEEEVKFSLDYKKKHFDFWVNYFSKRENARFLRHIGNGARFKTVVEQVFKEEGLPKELFFVGLIESGYNTHIKSRASAVGPWQFIKGTATRYGLRVDNSLDERRSIHKATLAAANYFKDLYNIFGSWELALCAYNAGEYRIINAIRKGNTRDYKELVRKKLLPKETIFYIPKVAAARYLVEEKKMGAKSHKESGFYENTEVIEFDKSFSFSDFVKKVGVNYNEMKKLNPDVKKDWVGYTRKGTSLVVPKRFAKIANAKADTIKSRRVVSKGSSFRYKVKRGDNLSRIARRYGTTVSELKSINGLRSGRIYIGQKLRIAGESSRSVASTKSTTHKVRSGENLSLIARKYGTSVSRLKRMNGLRSGRIYPGQKLKVAGQRKVYVVKRGDNLYRIARRFGLSVRKIVQANSLHKKTIYPNQEIILPI